MTAASRRQAPTMKPAARQASAVTGPLRLPETMAGSRGSHRNRQRPGVERRPVFRQPDDRGEATAGLDCRLEVRQRAGEIVEEHDAKSRDDGVGGSRREAVALPVAGDPFDDRAARVEGSRPGALDRVLRGVDRDHSSRASDGRRRGDGGRARAAAHVDDRVPSPQPGSGQEQFVQRLEHCLDPAGHRKPRARRRRPRDHLGRLGRRVVPGSPPGTGLSHRLFS